MYGEVYVQITVDYGNVTVRIYKLGYRLYIRRKIESKVETGQFSFFGRFSVPRTIFVLDSLHFSFIFTFEKRYFNIPWDQFPDMVCKNHSHHKYTKINKFI